VSIYTLCFETLLAAVNFKCDHTKDVQQKISGTYYEWNIQYATKTCTSLITIKISY
jgi:hypothetical protein